MYDSEFFFYWLKHKIRKISAPENQWKSFGHYRDWLSSNQHNTALGLPTPRNNLAMLQIKTGLFVHIIIKGNAQKVTAKSTLHPPTWQKQTLQRATTPEEFGQLNERKPRYWKVCSHSEATARCVVCKGLQSLPRVLKVWIVHFPRPFAKLSLASPPSSPVPTLPGVSNLMGCS